MEFTTYQTLDNQRWDTIAQIAYGNPYAYEGLIRANPEHRGRLVLPGGLLLRIPVLPETALAIPRSLLPPWKR